MSDQQPKIVFFLKASNRCCPTTASVMLAWADGDIGRRTITDLTPAQNLIVRFNPAARGALREV
jgi:hypothetical protein